MESNRFMGSRSGFPEHARILRHCGCTFRASGGLRLGLGAVESLRKGLGFRAGLGSWGVPEAKLSKLQKPQTQNAKCVIP